MPQNILTCKLMNVKSWGVEVVTVALGCVGRFEKDGRLFALAFFCSCGDVVGGCL